MANPLAENFNIERLVRQQGFLLDRAAAHDAAEGGQWSLHQACAAGLTLDAAAIALLLGDAGGASKHFLDSGRRFAGLGVFFGFPLLELGQPNASRIWRAQHQATDERVRDALASEEKKIQFESVSEPFLAASLNSPQQLLYLYEALSHGYATDENEYFLLNRLRSRLKSAPEMPVGLTASPLAGYLRLLDEAANLEDIENSKISIGALDTLLAIVLRRREQLNAAQADEWHWNKVLNPAALIDLDLLVLATIIIDRTGSTLAFDSAFEVRGSLVALPLRAAKLLRNKS